MNMRSLALCLLPLASACSSGPIAKAALDDEVRRLCAVDGGIKVYETVKLPAEKFNKWGQLNFRLPIKDDAKPEDDYYYEWGIQYYRQGNPELSRGHFKVVRQRDNKVLGESVYYGRGGGDITGPWHGTSFRCPQDVDISILKMHIFVHSTKEQVR